MRLFLFIAFMTAYFLWVPLLWASGAIDAVRQRQVEQEYQQAIIEQQQQEMVRQYMAAYQAAAVQQYVEAQKQAIAEAQKQAVAQYAAQQMALEIAAYQAAVIRRKEALAEQEQLRVKVIQNAQFQELLMAQQARQYVQQVVTSQVVAARQQQTMAEYQQAFLAKQIGEKAAYEQAQAILAAKTVQEAQEVMAYQQAQAFRRKNQLYEDIPPSYVKDVVPVSELWASFDTSAKAWPLIIDKKAKGVVISHYIDRLAKEGGVIGKDPLYYAQVIDDMSSQNPNMLEQPLKDVLTIAAVIEYDFDNGTDKNILARKIFPDERAFEANKKRLGK